MQTASPPRGRRVRRRDGASPPGATIEQLVHERILRAIIEQRLPPGTKLAEEPLGSLFGVSRARIRRVLLRLSHSRFIELRPNRGAYVAQPSPAEAREIFAARRAIEAYLVARASHGHTARQLRQLKRHVTRERVANLRGDRSAAIRLSGEFHLLIARIAGNDVLTRFLSELVSRTSLIIALYGGPGLSYCAYDEHQAILTELAGGHGEDAADLVKRHLERIEGLLDLDRERSGSVDLRQVLSGPGPTGTAGGV